MHIYRKHNADDIVALITPDEPVCDVPADAGLDNNSPEILIVGVDGTKILSGRLSRGENAVLVTAELVLSRLALL